VFVLTFEHVTYKTQSYSECLRQKILQTVVNLCNVGITTENLICERKRERETDRQIAAGASKETV
jgi:hypothetical protein